MILNLNTLTAQTQTSRFDNEWLLEQIADLLELTSC